MDQVIDGINRDGVNYKFADSEARDRLSTLSTRVTQLNTAQVEAVNTEKTRAEAAELALQNSKLNAEPGKGLSTNDFTDEYKEMLLDPTEFSGATSEEDGAKGAVPAPEAGDETKFLRGDGTWATPTDTQYSDATQSVHGLMSASDKTKLDGMDAKIDNEDSCTIEFDGNTITKTFGSGKVSEITFNNNGTISEVITRTDSTVTLTTTFNADGSITRTRVVS